jgi:excisionase family DNA binding protein
MSEPHRFGTLLLRCHLLPVVRSNPNATTTHGSPTRKQNDMNSLNRDTAACTEAPKLLLLKNQLGQSLTDSKVFEPLLSSVGAARLLNLHPVTLLRWAREGRVPHLRLGRKVMFRASELNSWCNSGYTCVAVRAA